MTNKRVYNRFDELLAIKARKSGRVITRADAAREMGLVVQSVARWGNNQITQFDTKYIVAFCEYLDCSISDLLILGEGEADKNA